MKPSRTLSMLLALTASAGLALAQPESTDSDLLKGPSVDQTDAKDKEARPEIDVEAELKKQPMDLRELTAAIRNLSSERSRVSLNLTEEQEKEIKAFTMQYREDIQAFQQANQVEIRKMRDQINKENREARERRKKEQESSDAMSDKAPQRPQGESDTVRKLRAFMASAPAAKAAIKNISGVLSEEQLEAVNKAVVVTRHRAKDRTAQRRGMEGERRQREGERRAKPSED